MTAAVDPEILAAVADIDSEGGGISWATLALLKNATPTTEIRTKPGRGGGPPMSYVDARYVMKRLDEVCGPFWQRAHIMEGEKVACGIGILVDGSWIWRWDGAGETDIEGEKGSFSDSFKRAGVNFGIARDLYPDASSSAGRAAPSARPAPQPVYEGMGDATDAEGPPVCPVHHKAMLASKPQYGGGWFCSAKAVGDQAANARGYCAYTTGGK